MKKSIIILIVVASAIALILIEILVPSQRGNGKPLMALIAAIPLMFGIVKLMSKSYK